MELLLPRDVAHKDCTEGRLVFEDSLSFFTIERPLVNWPGQDVPLAIPPGRYRLIRFHSPHRGYDVPLFVDVPGRSMIEIHIANWAADVRGCVGPGMERGKMGNAMRGIPSDTPAVLQSGKAFSRIMVRLNEAWDHGEEVWITVTNPAG